MPAPLWVVRHARPLIAPGICYGATDVEADAQHTAECAQALAPVLPAGTVVHCSPLRRCVQLADALRLLRPDLEFLPLDPRLAEMDFGCWEGVAWDAIPPAALAAWTDDFADHAFGGGESVQQLLDRVAAVFDSQSTGTTPTIWVTHSGVIRAAGLFVDGVSRISHSELWPRRKIEFGELLRLL